MKRSSSSLPRLPRTADQFSEPLSPDQRPSLLTVDLFRSGEFDRFHKYALLYKLRPSFKGMEDDTHLERHLSFEMKKLGIPESMHDSMLRFYESEMYAARAEEMDEIAERDLETELHFHIVPKNNPSKKEILRIAMDRVNFAKANRMALVVLDHNTLQNSDKVRTHADLCHVWYPFEAVEMTVSLDKERKAHLTVFFDVASNQWSHKFIASHPAGVDVRLFLKCLEDAGSHYGQFAWVQVNHMADEKRGMTVDELKGLLEEFSIHSIEVDHPEHSVEQRRALEDVAEAHGLVISSGADVSQGHEVASHPGYGRLDRQPLRSSRTAFDRICGYFADQHLYRFSDVIEKGNLMEAEHTISHLCRLIPQDPELFRRFSELRFAQAMKDVDEDGYRQLVHIVLDETVPLSTKCFVLPYLIEVHGEEDDLHAPLLNYFERILLSESPLELKRFALDFAGYHSDLCETVMAIARDPLTKPQSLRIQAIRVLSKWSYHLPVDEDLLEQHQLMEDELLMGATFMPPDASVAKELEVLRCSVSKGRYFREDYWDEFEHVVARQDSHRLIVDLQSIRRLSAQLNDREKKQIYEKLSKFEEFFGHSHLRYAFDLSMASLDVLYGHELDTRDAREDLKRELLVSLPARERMMESMGCDLVDAIWDRNESRIGRICSRFVIEHPSEAGGCVHFLRSLYEEGLIADAAIIEEVHFTMRELLTSSDERLFGEHSALHVAYLDSAYLASLTAFREGRYGDTCTLLEDVDFSQSREDRAAHVFKLLAGVRQANHLHRLDERYKRMRRSNRRELQELYKTKQVPSKLMPVVALGVAESYASGSQDRLKWLMLAEQSNIDAFYRSVPAVSLYLVELEKREKFEKVSDLLRCTSETIQHKGRRICLVGLRQMIREGRYAKAFQYGDAALDHAPYDVEVFQEMRRLFELDVSLIDQYPAVARRVGSINSLEEAYFSIDESPGITYSEFHGMLVNASRGALVMRSSVLSAEVLSHAMFTKSLHENDLSDEEQRCFEQHILVVFESLMLEGKDVEARAMLDHIQPHHLPEDYRIVLEARFLKEKGDPRRAFKMMDDYLMNDGEARPLPRPFVELYEEVADMCDHGRMFELEAEEDELFQDFSLSEISEEEAEASVGKLKGFMDFLSMKEERGLYRRLENALQ